MEFTMRQKATRWGQGLGAALVALFALGTVSPAQATFVLAFDLDGDPRFPSTPIVEVFDQGALDLNPAVGAITFNGPVGAFNINVATSLSKPVVGPAVLDLNSVNISSTVPGSITVITSDTNYGPISGPANLISNINGIVNPSTGSISVLSGVQGADLLNELYGMFFFDEFVHFVEHGPFGRGPFVDTKSVGFDGGGVLFSLTEAVTITHDRAGVTSFNIRSQVVSPAVVPEPATLALLALGLIGVAGFARRRAL